jgi:2-oxoacid:acceptor oxidoreductase delta subunit (pyruvate/2-ketoisovalerate family)
VSVIKPNAGWKDLPQGGIIPEGGTAAEFNTGDWRSQKPLWDEEKCINCLQCWVNCPDSSIKVADQKMIGIDYKHCKGCGICAEVCPPKAGAIHMESE